MESPFSEQFRLDALKRALETLKTRNVIIQEITNHQAIFKAIELTEEDIHSIIDLIAGWIGRTPIARQQDNLLILHY